MKALRSSLEKARELKLNSQAMEGKAGGVDKSQQQMIMELYQKCATLKVQLPLRLVPTARYSLGILLSSSRVQEVT